MSPTASPVPSAAPARASYRGFRLVGMLTLVSRLLGMVRDIVMAAAFGATPVMDAFSVAFRVPNLARRLFGEGAQTSAFLPEFVRTQEHEGLPAAQELAGGMWLTLGLLLTGLVVASEATLALVLWLTPLSADAALLVELLLWLLPYLICICLAAQQSAVLHALHRFGWPAALPVVLNLLWLAAIPVVFTAMSDAVDRIRCLCAAILAAGIVQAAIPSIVLARQGFPLWAPLTKAWPRVRRVLQHMAPVLVGVTITQFNTVFDSAVAWLLAPGSDGAAGAVRTWTAALPELPNGTASALYFGQRMYQFPLGLIGVGLSTVLFPQFTRHAERGDRELLNRDLADGLGLTLSIGLPAGIGLMLLAEPMTRLLFEHGAYTPEAGVLTGQMIFGYGLGVPAFIGLLIVQRGYYAVGDRVTPVRHGLIAVLANVVLDLVLLAALGAAGLAWATSLSACLQLGIATIVLQRSVGVLLWEQLSATLLRTLLACVAMGAACHWTASTAGDGLASRLQATLLPLAAGAAAYLAVAAAIGLREPWRLLSRGTLVDECESEG